MRFDFGNVRADFSSGALFKNGQHIAWLRQKIEDEPGSPAHIVTVRGEGYRFEK